jgi:hypothetical protein
MSRQITSPSGVQITYNPSADELMTDWLAERVQRAIAIVIDAARGCSVDLREIWVAGYESYEEPTREIAVNAEIETVDDEAGYAYWGAVAEPIYKLNQPLPPGTENADVTVQVSVNW